tara:strand:+ start:358 stop:1929 length:1572 start_codon:yes stop_codon:yes gene_type:complete
MVCTVDIINAHGWHHEEDLGLRFQNSGNGTVDAGMPHHKNDWGMTAKVSECGDDYAVYLWEHNHGGDWSSEKNHGQNHMVMQDGKWWLHHLYGGVSRATIRRVPNNADNKMVGYQDAHWISDYSIKNGTERLWHHGYEIRPGQWVEQPDLCPGDGEMMPLSMHNEFNGGHSIAHRYACVYDKNETKLDQVYNGTRGTNREEMYHDLVNRLCSKKENIAFTLPGGSLCAQHSAGKAMAVEFCQEGNNFTEQGKVCSASGLSALAAGGQATYNELLKWYCGKGGNIKEARCDALTNTDYNSVAETYCKTAAGRADPFCTCYNVVNGVCDRHGSAAGCAKKKQTFDKLVAATPADQRNVWSGMESCFGRVCTGAGKYIPPNTNQNCNKSVNVCIQDIDIGSMTDSNIQAKCDIKSNDGPASPPSVSTPPAGSPPPVSQEELEEAKAAAASGDPAAQARLKELEDRIKESEENSITAFIPMSLEDLKTNRKKQFGAFGGVGSFMMMCLCLLLLVVIAGKGGRRSVRR